MAIKPKVKTKDNSAQNRQKTLDFTGNVLYAPIKKWGVILSFCVAVIAIVFGYFEYVSEDAYAEKLNNGEQILSKSIQGMSTDTGKILVEKFKPINLDKDKVAAIAAGYTVLVAEESQERLELLDIIYGFSELDLIVKTGKVNVEGPKTVDKHSFPTITMLGHSMNKRGTIYSAIMNIGGKIELWTWTKKEGDITWITNSQPDIYECEPAYIGLEGVSFTMFLKNRINTKYVYTLKDISEEAMQKNVELTGEGILKIVR